MKKHISLLLLGSLIFGTAMPAYAESQREPTESLITAQSDSQKAKLEAQIVKISTQDIAYYESDGKGPTIFLVHGNSSSGRSYINQLQSELGQKYRLIAMDLPGHGLSDVAADPEATYSLPGYAAVVVEVAEALDASDAIFVGWSLGGHILLEAAERLTEARGIAIFGTPPIADDPPDLENAFLPHSALGLGFTPKLSKEDMLAYVTTFFRPNIEEIPELFFEDKLLRI